MTDISGLRFCEPFAHYDPDSSCWRTSEATFPWGSDEFSETWPKRGSMRNGVCYERQMSAHPMAELESLLLPTPTAGDSKGSRNSTAHRNKIPPTGIHPGDTLTDAAWKLLPTPTARDGKAGLDYRKRTEGDDLYQAASRIGSSTHRPSPDGSEPSDVPLPFR